jgi:cysteine desulfurase/selenocysteine lyase
VSAIGLGAAIDYLSAIGMEAIHQHERLLCARAHEVLGAIGGLKFLGPAPEHKGGIVSFTLERVHAHDVAQVLDRQGVAVRAGHHCAMPLHKRLRITASTRASFYLYNTPAEVDQLGRAIEETKRIFRRK